MDSCLQKSCHFSPFIVLMDGLLGVESEATIKYIDSRLATKWNHLYLQTCGYVKSRVYITLVCATQHCIWGSRVPAHKVNVQQPQW